MLHHPSPLPDRTTVLIVGAGPVGLTVAACLQQNGVDHVLVDRLHGGANESRACIVHARTLEVLEDLDVTLRLVKIGVPTPRFTLHDGGRRLGAIDFSRLPSQYPYALMVPQNVTESVLTERLTELGGTVHRRVEVTKIRDHGPSVTVDIDDNGLSQQINATYVVGADGSHSVVREQAGIEFVGDTYPESFVLADVRLDGVPDDEVQLHMSAQGVTVLAPLPGGRHRIVATVGDLADGVQTPEHPDLAYVQHLLDVRVPGSRASDPGWTSRFLVHHRIATTYRVGRLLLAGDAAHVHSPAGGQGMNTGIQDAVVLAADLTAATRGEESTLDAYEHVRRPVAEQVVTLTDRMTRMATLRTSPARATRDIALHALLGIPAVGRRLARTAAELDHR